jgi:hypothetical protein
MKIQLDQYREIEILESDLYKAYVVECFLFEEPKIVSKHKSVDAAIKAGIRNGGNFRWIIFDNQAFKPEAFMKFRWHK